MMNILYAILIVYSIACIFILGYVYCLYKQAPIEHKDECEQKQDYEKHDRLRVYLAGSIFYEGDELRNTKWAKKIRDAIPNVDLYSPIENIEINGVEGKKKFAGSKEIIKADNARLNKADILIACLDGDVIPSGTCAEIGKFHEKIARGDHKYIIGVCTDNRQMFLTHSLEKDVGGASALGEQQYSYQNVYVTGLTKDGGILVSSIDDAIRYIKSKLNEFIDDKH